MTSIRVFAQPTIVAFEAGEWRPSEHHGSSVLLVGRASAASELDAVRFAERGLLPWIGGQPALYVQVMGGVVTGQRVVGWVEP